MTLNFKIDDTSLKILALLEENARISYTEIGKIVNLSSSTVADKVRKLEDLGIIDKYTIKVNYESLDLNIMAVILVNISGIFGFQEKKFVELVKTIPEIVECLRITGTNDFMLKVVVKSVNELREVNDTIAGFGQVNTSIVVDSHGNSLFNHSRE